jgi:hypothetical protein
VRVLFKGRKRALCGRISASLTCHDTVKEAHKGNLAIGGHNTVVRPWPKQTKEAVMGKKVRIASFNVENLFNRYALLDQPCACRDGSLVGYETTPIQRNNTA